LSSPETRRWRGLEKRSGGGDPISLWDRVRTKASADPEGDSSSIGMADALFDTTVFIDCYRGDRGAEALMNSVPYGYCTLRTSGLPFLNEGQASSLAGPRNGNALSSSDRWCHLLRNGGRPQKGIRLSQSGGMRVLQARTHPPAERTPFSPARLGHNAQPYPSLDRARPGSSIAHHNAGHQR
jgi:hypothetical protein